VSKVTEEMWEEYRNGHHENEVPLLVGIKASEVITKPVEWLWDKRIPKGKLTMFDGDPDVGKSVITMDLAARVSTGRTFPDGAPCQAGNVLIVNVEDAKDDTIVPRLKAHGADLERITILDGMPTEDGVRLLDLPEDVPSLKASVEHDEAALLIIDPVLTMLSGDAYKDTEARKALTPLRDMAEETGVTVVAVRHLNKNTSLSAIQRGGGNMGLIGVARAGAFFAHHPEIDGLRVMAPHKSNLAEKQPSLQYVVVGWAIDENIGRVEWRGATEHDANSLASGPASPAEKTKQDEAMEFLRDELADGPEWARTIYQDAHSAGISRGTLLIAKSTLRVRSEKVGTQGWQWSLPEGTNQDPTGPDKGEGTKDSPIPDSLEPLEPLIPSISGEESESPYIKEGTKDAKDTKGSKDTKTREEPLAPSLAAYEDDSVRQLVEEGWTEAAAIAGVIKGLEEERRWLDEWESVWQRPRIRLRIEKLKKRQQQVSADLSADEGNKPQRSPEELREVADELSELMRKRKLKSARAKELKSILVEEGERRQGDSDEDDDTKKIETLLLAPPPWLQKQLVKYADDADRFTEPTCSAIAAKALGDPSRWEEVVPILQGTS
jgi:hypothetical protein